MFATFLFFVLLCNCQTLYRNSYQDFKFNNNLYQVITKCNEYTSFETAKKMFLLRCCEIAKMNNKKNFIILNEASGNDVSQTTIFSYNDGLGYAFPIVEKKPYIKANIKLIDENEIEKYNNHAIYNVDYVYKTVSYLLYK